MKKNPYLRIVAAVSAILWVATLAFTLPSRAQQTYTPDDAIAFVASHPQFAEGLASAEGWTAQAYNTGNRYGIWHVTFWNAEGEEIGSADVSLEQERLYTVDTHFYPSEAVLRASEDALFEFLRSHPEIQELLDNPWEHEMYLDYNPWITSWSVWIDNGDDPLYAWVGTDGTSPFSTNGLRLTRIGFGNIMSWEDWHSGNSASAIATAFNQPDIAARMRAIPGWTSQADRIEGEDGNIWWVGFFQADILTAEAIVNVMTQEVLSHTLY
jgi:hypothetical protein